MNIVQIGTNRAYDNLTTIVKNLSDQPINLLLMVEPFEIHNPSIIKCYEQYKNALCIENIIISPTIEHNNTLKIYYHEEDFNDLNTGELASLNNKHTLNIRSYYVDAGMKYSEITTLNINELFNKYKLTNIDILYIDTEGFDDQIIYSINFDKYFINKIYYEHLHIDKYKLREFLKSKQYSIVSDITGDSYSELAEYLK